MADIVEIILTATDLASGEFERAAVRVQRASERMDQGVSGLDRSFGGADRNARQLASGLVVVGDAGDRAAQGFERAAAGADSFSASADRVGRSTRTLNTDLDRTRGVFERIGGAMQTAGRGMKVVDDRFATLNQGVSRVSRVLGTFIVLLPALATGLAGAATAAVTLAAGATALASTLSSLVGVAGAAAAGITALAGAFGAALSVIGPGIAGIVEGVSALEAASNKAISSSQSSARAIRDAQQGLASAQREGARAIRDAEQALAEAREDGARRIKESQEALKELRLDNARQEIELEQRIAEAREDAAERISDAEFQMAQRAERRQEQEANAQKRLDEARRRAATAGQDAMEAAAKAQADAAERIAELEEDRVDLIEDNAKREQDAIERLNETRIEGARRVMEAETALARMQQDNNRTQQQLERQLADARAGAAAAAAEGDPGAALAAGLVSERETDLAAFIRERAREERDSAEEVAQARIDAVKDVQEAEERLMEIREENAERLEDLEERIADVRESAAERAAEASQRAAEQQAAAAEAVAEAEANLAEIREDNTEEAARDAEEFADLQEELAEQQTRLEEQLAELKRDNREEEEQAIKMVAEARRQAAEDIRDAEERLADVRIRVSESIRDAEESLQDARQSGAASALALNAEWQKLSPLQQEIARQIIALKDAWLALTAVARNTALSEFRSWLFDIEEHLPQIAAQMSDFSDILVDLSERARGEIFDPQMFATLNSIADTAQRNLRRMGDAAIDLGAAFIVFLDAAGPFSEWVFDGIESWAKWVRGTVEAAEKSGELARMFEAFKEPIEAVVGAISNLGAVLIDIGEIGFPFGVELLQDFERFTEKIREFTESTAGQNQIRQFFEDAMPAVRELAGALSDTVEMFFRLGRAGIEGGENSGFVQFMRAIRTQFIPWLEDFSTQAARTFGPALFDMLEQLGPALTHLVSNNGPLTIFIRVLGFLLEGFNKLPGPAQTAISHIILWGGALGFGVTKIGEMVENFGSLAGAFVRFGRLLGGGEGGPGIIARLGTFGSAVADIGRTGFTAMRAGLATAGTAIAGFGASLLATARAAIPAMIAGVRALGVAIMANPIGLAITAIVALITLLIVKWDDAKKFFKAFADFMVDAGKAVWDFLKDMFQGIVDAAQAVVDFFSGAWSKLVDLISGPLSAVTETLAEWGEQLLQWAKDAWEAIAGAFSDAWDAIKDAARKAWDAIKGVITKAWNAIVDFFTKGGARAFEAIKNALSGLWDAIKGTASTAWGAIKSVVTTAWNAVKNFFVDGVSAGYNAIKGALSKLWEEIKTTAGNLWDSIKGVVTNTWHAIRDFFTRAGLGDAIADGIKGAWNKVKDVTGDVWAKIKDGIEWFVNKIIDGINFIITKIGMDKIGHVNITGNKPPGYAKGGIVQPAPGGVYMVAEAGYPEAVITLDPKYKDRSRRVVRQVIDELDLYDEYIPRFAQSGLVFPVQGPWTAGGGPAAHASRAWGDWQSDNAWDILTQRIGQPAVAVTRGRIGTVKLSSNGLNYSANPAGYGIYLTENQGPRGAASAPVPGRTWWYTHMWGSSVRPGQLVMPGQFMGPIGGANSVKHLHIAVERPWDPVSLLSGAPGLGQAGPGMLAGMVSGIFDAAGNLLWKTVDAAKKHLPGLDLLDRFQSVGSFGMDLLKGAGKFLLDKAWSWVKGKLQDAIEFFFGGDAPNNAHYDIVPPIPEGARNRAITNQGNVSLGQRLAAARGWGSGPQWEALVNLWRVESGWSHLAGNPTSGAYGIPQALPADKMASAGADWRTNPETQIKWGLGYIGGRYTNPLGAWKAWVNNYPPGWYHEGGIVPGGPRAERFAMLRGREWVLTPAQVERLRRLLGGIDWDRLKRLIFGRVGDLRTALDNTAEVGGGSTLSARRVAEMDRDDAMVFASNRPVVMQMIAEDGTVVQRIVGGGRASGGGKLTLAGDIASETRGTIPATSMSLSADGKRVIGSSGVPHTITPFGIGSSPIFDPSSPEFNTAAQIQAIWAAQGFVPTTGVPQPPIARPPVSRPPGGGGTGTPGSGGGSGAAVNMNIYTTSPRVDIDYVLRAAQQRLSERA